MKKNKAVSFQGEVSSPMYKKHIEAIEVIEQNGATLAITPKFIAGQKELIAEEIEDIFDQNPDLPLHSVLSIIMENMPDYLSGAVLLELTQFTIEQWNHLQDKVLYRI